MHKPLPLKSLQNSPVKAIQDHKKNLKHLYRARCAHVKGKAKMCIYVCGLSWQLFLFRETINPPLIIGLTYPHLAYKSWYYTHAHVNY